jgi:hypothetical protein
MNWVDGMRAVSYADGVLTAQARHDGVRDWIVERLGNTIEETVSSLTKHPIAIHYAAASPIGNEQRLR